MEAIPRRARISGTHVGGGGLADDFDPREATLFWLHRDLLKQSESRTVDEAEIGEAEMTEIMERRRRDGTT